MVWLKHNDIQKSCYSEILLIGVKNSEEAAPHHRSPDVKMTWRWAEGSTLQTPLKGSGSDCYWSWVSMRLHRSSSRHKPSACLVPFTTEVSVDYISLKPLFSIQNSGKTTIFPHALSGDGAMPGVWSSSPVTEPGNVAVICHCLWRLSFGQWKLPCLETHIAVTTFHTPNKQELAVAMRANPLCSRTLCNEPSGLHKKGFLSLCPSLMPLILTGTFEGAALNHSLPSLCLKNFFQKPCYSNTLPQMCSAVFPKPSPLLILHVRA